MKTTLWIMLVLGLSTLGTADNSTVCCDVEGCFSNGEPWSSSSRPVPTPQCEVLDHTYVTLYTRSDSDGRSVTVRPSILLDDFNSTLVVHFLISASMADSSHLYQIKDAILSRQNANVFFLTWGERFQGYPCYLRTVSDARVVGALVSRMKLYLKENYNLCPSDMYCVGLAVGAHVCGYGGRPLQWGRITALDATAPLFDGFCPEVRVNTNDAKLLVAIHSNSRSLRRHTGVGIIKPIGHVDFYVNGGEIQPNCKDNTKRPIVRSASALQGKLLKDVVDYVTCPLLRAAEVYAYAISNPDCTMWGHKRKFWGWEITVSKPVRNRKFERCTLATCTPVGSETAKFPGRGSFYLPTTKEAPFCCPEPDTDATMYELLANSKQ